MATEEVRVLGLAGSLRAGSFNRALLRAAVELVPKGMSIEIFERLAELPLYSEDVLGSGAPEVVADLKSRTAGADALLIVSPEYNYSIPGVLKNAIDWASRPLAESPLRGKPVALMGASTGLMGTVRAQSHLRQVAVFTQMLVLVTPEVYVARAADKFDADGRLVDEDTRTRVAQLLEALRAWTLRIQGGPR